MRKIVSGWVLAGLVALATPTVAEPPDHIPAQPPVLSLPAFQPTEIGIASWYGEKFQGSPTANGEIYDMNRLTAAHPSLPFGTRVKVTNLKNSRTLVLRVNDRGPYIDGRHLDVSKAAARRLGFLLAGLTPVQIDVMTYPMARPRAFKPGGVGTARLSLN